MSGAPADSFVRFDPAWVLLEDADTLAVDKPPGLVVDATRDPARPFLVGLATAWLAARGEPVEVRAVHRLDAATSGVVVLAKTRARTTALMRAFEARTVDKRYVAVVAGRPTQDDWTVQSYLAHNRGRTTAVRAGGRRSETAIAVLQRGPDLALVEAQPVTGRTHQIRVHLADSGHPILGDPLYAPPAARDRTDRMMLHAHRLTITLEGEVLELESPIPAGFAALTAR